jgi:hypothetical protein
MGPFKCPDCGIWWAGPEHRCRPVPDTTSIPGTVVYPFATGINVWPSNLPWCAICHVHHTPGAGCTGTWTLT